LERATAPIPRTPGNPDQAPIKATAELSCNHKGAQEKLEDFLAEIMAVAHLHSVGYRDFDVVLAQNQPLPDFMARFEDRLAAIEVKNLHEPADILRNIAVRHWKEITEAQPERYGFRVVLRHQRCGRLTTAAQQRLCNILTQTPDIRNFPHTETLDGGIAIRVERPENRTTPTVETAVLDHLAAGRKSQLVVVTAVNANDLSTGTDEVQALFLKTLRVVATATPKFFKYSYTPKHRNVIALHWNPPEFMYSPEMLAYTSEQIEKLFEAFSLQLTPIIFCDPALPWPLLKQYT
jgi:hypothetical protein